MKLVQTWMKLGWKLWQNSGETQMKLGRNSGFQLDSSGYRNLELRA